MLSIWNALIDAELLPDGSSPPLAALAKGPGDDLLPVVVQAWMDHHRTSGQSEGNEKPGLLRQHSKRGAKLTWGVPESDNRCLATWLGTRLAWWPRGIPEGRRVGLVSSRLGHNLDCRKSWFTVLRAACMKLDRQREVLLTAGSVTTGSFVERCGELFGLRVLHIDVERDDRASLLSWARRTVLADEAQATRCDIVSLSPPLSLEEDDRIADSLAQLPATDRAVVALSDRLAALHVRPGGYLNRLLRARLDEPAFSPTSVYLALGPDLVRKDVADDLMTRGAVGWFVLNTLGQPNDNLSPPWTHTLAQNRSPAPVIPLPALSDWPYLTHCTRKRQGPWPDEEENQFLDDLILDRAGADHSALAALWRIVQTSRLIAGSEMVRGATSVVSFTAVPLAEIHHLHTYRSHLSRWDFEPYGICIRRDWLQSYGARAVRYGEEDDWKSLQAEERPYFQKKQSKTPGGHIMDWTAEHEWRHVGDIQLAEIPPDAALLFVPTETEAKQLAAISHWPVVVVPSTKNR